MEQFDVLGKLVERLEGLGMDYYISGSFASNYHGMPRLTHDIDVVVKIGPSDIDGIVQSFSPDSYISEDGIREALTGSGMFNAIDNMTAFKVDFWVFRGDPFGRSCFERACRAELAPGCLALIASPEDVILHKLLWNRISPSDRQWKDARGVMLVQKERLDMGYMKNWAATLNLEKELDSLVADKRLPNIT